MAVPPFARQPPETVREFETDRQFISLIIMNICKRNAAGKNRYEVMAPQARCGKFFFKERVAL
jgi:hypothetical protein